MGGLKSSREEELTSYCYAQYVLVCAVTKWRSEISLELIDPPFSSKAGQWNTRCS